MVKAALFLTLTALVVFLAGCAMQPATPTPTAIALATTATPRPRWTPSQPTSPPPSAGPSPTGVPTETALPAPAGPSRLDRLLAERTVEAFASRLARGEAAVAFDLFLTDAAQEGEAGRLLPRFTAPNPPPSAFTLLELKGTGPASQEAQVLLQWGPTSSGEGEATQLMTLALRLDRGLWLIDGITLGELQAVPSATPRAARSRPGSAPRAPAPGLSGKLVFQVSSGGDIDVISVDGSGLRRLADGLDPAWSPDGTRIAFTRWRAPWGVYLIQPDGRGEERVADGIRFKEVAWSPDGSRIAVTVNTGSAEPIEICFFGRCFTLPPFSLGQMWLFDLDGSQALSLPLDDRAVHSPTWSPDGNRIVYAGERGLAWIDLDPAPLDKGRFDGGSAWDGSPSYSPDGAKIAYMSRVHNHWEIFSMNANGSDRQRLTHSDPAALDPPNNVAPCWSPDGKFIAFLSDRDGPWRIYVMDAAGGSQRPLFGSRLDRLGIRYEFASERVLSWGP